MDRIGFSYRCQMGWTQTINIGFRYSFFKLFNFVLRFDLTIYLIGTKKCKILSHGCCDTDVKEVGAINKLGPF